MPLSSLPILVTMGDPAGVGPEVILKALPQLSSEEQQRLVIIGEEDLLRHRADRFKLAWTNPRIQSLGLLSDYQNDQIHSQTSSQDFEIGKLSAKSGDAAYRYFDHAITECISNKASAIVTAPLNKEAMNMAGHHFVGHTDILEQRCGQEVVMSLVLPKLIVSHVTDHLPLRKAIDRITPERIRSVIKMTWDAIASVLKETPRIAVAGLNPHAGENGLFGQEEIEIINPCIKALADEGYPCFGALPGDTVFREALSGKFNGVIAMYHDQGFGPIKTAAFESAVNCTLGLPFVRTSVDHGTAFNIASQGIADERPMLAALRVAFSLVDQG